MAESHSARAPHKAISRSATTTEPVEAPPLVRFVRYFFTRLVLQEVAKPTVEPGDEPAGIDSITIEVSVEVRVGDDKTAATRMTAHIVPDPRWKPYDIHIQIVGVFATQNTSVEQLGEFCREIAPVLLFPYVREATSRLTSDAQYGSILLPPFNIKGLLSKHPWKDEPVGAEAPGP